MIVSTELFAALIVSGVGVLILWANPRRSVNRAVFLCSQIVAAWLFFTHIMALPSKRGLIWLRCICGVGGLVPLTLWLVKEAIVMSGRPTMGQWVLQNLFWFGGGLLFFVLPFTDAFIPAHSSEEERLRGWGYYTYYAGLIGTYVWLFIDSLRSLKGLTGVRRQELQVWLFGGCGVAATIYLLIGLTITSHDPFYRTLKTPAVLVFYIGTVYMITTHRVFDARQILLVGTEKLLIGFVVAISAYVLHANLTLVLPAVPALVTTSLVVVWLAHRFGGWLDARFQFLPEGMAARQAAFSTAQRETRVENLEKSFCSLLKGWAQAERAVIISTTKDQLAGSGITLAIDEPIVGAMKQLRWATPERLTRERASAGRSAVGRFLTEQGLNALVVEEGPALTVLVGIGPGAARRPFTYPQITQLMELSSIIQGALERAHFSAKVQHTEQLATVGLLGASLAHEIRNPLVSIKTFVQLLPTHHQDPRFREKFFQLIGDEVGRIDQLTEQLLDLASPRTYEAKLIELHPLLRSSLDLVAAKAAHRNVDFRTEFGASPDAAFTDASAAKQVMLNLCFNAIQAVEEHQGPERWVKIATRNTPGGIEMAVADSGPGIQPEIRPKLFQPFQTTKSTGFGLGLAICSDILSNLHANITVDPPQPGRGATFRVTFPCRPLSS